jgi:hypothetical protein
VHLADEYGIENVEQSAYVFDALEDRPAQAVLTLPAEDRTVLPTAVVEVRGEGL